jgi:hypothetical protein
MIQKIRGNFFLSFLALPVQIGAITTIPDQDNSSLTESNQGSAPTTPNGSACSSGNAGSRFGGQRYRQSGTVFADNNDLYGLGECCGGQQEYFIIYFLLKLLVIFNMYCHHCT